MRKLPPLARFTELVCIADSMVAIAFTPPFKSFLCPGASSQAARCKAPLSSLLSIVVLASRQSLG